MILKNVISCEYLYPTTIFKLLLGKSTITSFMGKFVEMKNMMSLDFENFYNSTSRIVNNKKNLYLLGILNCNKFLKINNWFKYNIIYPDGYDKTVNCKIFDENQCDLIGPYLSDKYIIFYKNSEKLMLVFTYFPIHILEKKNGLTDSIVRELKSYVYDNVDPEIFSKMVLDKIDKDLNIEDLENPKSITARYSSNKNRILKIVNILGNYQWSVLTKSDNFNNKGVV